MRPTCEFCQRPDFLCECEPEDEIETTVARVMVTGTRPEWELAGEFATENGRDDEMGGDDDEA